MVQRASSCPTQASRTAGAEASDLAGFLESYCLAMLASITSTVFIQLITYSPKLYFFFTNFPIPELPFLSTKPQHPFLSPLSLDICIRSFQSNQFCSVAQSCLTLCNPMNWSTPVFLVHHHLPELAQTHVHQVSNAIQPSHSLLSPSPPTFNLSQHRVFSKESVLHIRWPKYWSFSLSIRTYNEHSGPISHRKSSPIDNFPSQNLSNQLRLIPLARPSHFLSASLKSNHFICLPKSHLWVPCRHKKT